MSDLDGIRNAINSYSRGEIELDVLLRLMAESEQARDNPPATKASRSAEPAVLAQAVANRIRRL